MINPELRETLSRIELLSTKQLFFIVGIPRSGTTWLQRMLNAHKLICCKGEAHFVDIFFANLRKSIQDYNKVVRLQGGIIAHLREYGGHVDSLEYTTEDSYLLLYYAMYLMFDKWIDSTSVTHLGEKTPDNILSMNLLAVIFPKARFIHLIRDGRDAAVSGWHFNNAMRERNKTAAQTFQSYIHTFLKQWQSGIQYADAIGATLGDRYLEVRYESLVTDAVHSLDAVLGFLEVDSSSGAAERCIASESFERLTKGRSAGAEQSDAFFRKGIIGDWRNHLDDEMADRAWRLAGDRLLALGYSRQ